MYNKNYRFSLSSARGWNYLYLGLLRNPPRFEILYQNILWVMKNKLWIIKAVYLSAEAVLIQSE